ncbi:hypothetical protein AAC387_Pa11g1361 [Persea americana]
MTTKEVSISLGLVTTGQFESSSSSQRLHPSSTTLPLPHSYAISRTKISCCEIGRSLSSICLSKSFEYFTTALQFQIPRAC